MKSRILLLPAIIGLAACQTGTTEKAKDAANTAAESPKMSMTTDIPEA